MRIYKNNGFFVLEEEELIYREYLTKYFSFNICNFLKQKNKAFSNFQIETPILNREEDCNKEYFLEKDYIFKTNDFILRPETTKGSYWYAKELLTHHEEKLPFVVWQYGKSFRNEQDKTIKNVRLKEFYQMEFQIFYSNTTKADYPSLLKEFVLSLVKDEFRGNDVKLEISDRLPCYSLETTDILIEGLEICSMSLRNDFEKNINNFELAFGLDRLLFKKHRSSTDAHTSP